MNHPIDLYKPDFSRMELRHSDIRSHFKLVLWRITTPISVNGLCLYLPRGGEFDTSEALSESISWLLQAPEKN